MAGLTDTSFRRLMRRHGCPMVTSELVSSTGMEYSFQKSLRILAFHEEEKPVGLQIFGDNPEHMLEALRKIEALGADFADLNLGCPVQKVVRRGAGAAACRDVPKLYALLKQAARAVKIPVSMKIRTGWDNDHKNAVEVVRAGADAGISWVAVHGRTRAQGYAGTADWDAIGEVKAKSTIPVIGNGDITTPELAVERFKTYGVDAVMIGRGALRRPLIFEESAALLHDGSYAAGAPGNSSFIGLIREHRALIAEQHEGHLVPAMVHARKFMSYYATGMRGCHELRKKLFEYDDPELIWNEAERFFMQIYNK